MPLSLSAVRRNWLDVLARAGRFDRHAQVDWQRVERLVFVCKGNICRSVYAERKSIDGGLNAVSAGLETRGGMPANQIARRVASLRGVDLDNHLTRRLEDIELGYNDLVVAMEPWQIFRAAELERNESWQLTLGGLWLSPKRAVIADPYGENDEAFERAFVLLDQLVARLALELK